MLIDPADLEGLDLDPAILEQVEEELRIMERAENITKCLSADNLKSRPTEAQADIFKAKQTASARYYYILGGNQTLIQGSPILRPSGVYTPIEELNSGDEVMCFDTKLGELVVTKVDKVHDHGVLDFYTYRSRTGRSITATENHEMVTFEDGKYIKKQMLTNPTVLYFTPEGYGVWAQLVEKEYVGKHQGYDLTVFHEDHNYICNGYVSGNSGKTSVNVRELVWMIEETHPYWKKFNSRECNCGNKNITKFGHETVPTYSCKECGNNWKDWGTNPINFILCGENRTNIILNLWTRIEPLLLEPEKWKKLMIGSVHAGYQHRETKNSLLFFPHGQGEEKTRKAVQGFTYHGAFLDELPGPAVIEELQRRVDAQMGFFQAAFTMKTVNHDTLRFMNGQVKSGAALIFKLSKLDNPVNAGRREEELAKLAGLPKSKQDQILYGDVEASSEKIFQYLYEDIAVEELPPHYSQTTWEHYEWIDPADTHKACWSLFARDPQTDNWHWVRCEIIENIKSPKTLCMECIKFAANYHITFRGADDHKWFISTMKEEFGLIYKVPKGKRRGRFVKAKVDMIKFAQTFLDSRRFQILAKLEGVFGELSDFRWKDEDKGEIVNPHKFHRLDTFIYFVDGLPKAVKDEMELTGPITEADRRRRIKEYNRNKTLAKDNSGTPRRQFVFLKGLTSRLGRANLLGQVRRGRR